MHKTIFTQAAAFLVAISLSGCVSSQQTDAAHEVLNVITDVTQPSYRVFSAFCTEAQWAITRDAERTVAVKKAAVAKVRTECHRVYDLFEEVIAKQKTAREILNAATTAADIVQAAGVVAELKSLLQKAQAAAAAMREKGSEP